MFTIILTKQVCDQPIYMHFNVNGGYALCYHTDQNNRYVPDTRTTIPRDQVFSQINWVCDHLGYRVQLDTRFENESEYYSAMDAMSSEPDPAYVWEDMAMDYQQA